jgi:hypothetical protein
MAYLAIESDLLPTVQDFEAMCHYINTERPFLTAGGDLSTKACFALTALLSHPRADAQPRNRMEKYPAVHLYFHLALASGLLTTYAGKGGKAALALSESYPIFEKLSLSGKYLFIVLAWIYHADIEQLYARDSIPPSFLYAYINALFADIGRQTEFAWIPREQDYAFFDHIKKPLLSLMRNHYEFLCHFRAFGWLEFDDARVHKKDTYYITLDELRVTPLGACLCSVCDSRKLSWINKFALPALLPEEEEEDPPEIKLFRAEYAKNPPGSDGFLAPFLPCFPAGAIDRAALNSLLFPPPPKISKKAVYEFKVQLGRGCYRVIACAGKHTFEKLHLAIQKAFAFDNDHLYSFFLDGRSWSRHAVNHPYSEEPPYADEVLIGQVGLRERQSILYLFDFGDSWEFQVTVTSIYDADSPLKRPVILKAVGEAPEQYPDWDEEYEDDEEE